MYKEELYYEIIEEMPEYNLKIIQNDKYFKFGVDSIALAKFAASNKSNNIILDICSGSGVVGLVYSRLIENKIKENNLSRKIKKMYFIEKQQYFSYLNQKNIEINKFKNYKVLNLDIKDPKIYEQIKPESVDIILINPPYYLTETSIPSEIKEKFIAKFEDENFLDIFFKLSNTLLKNKGEIFMVNKFERLVDIFCMSRKNNIEPKILQPILSNPLKKNDLVLLKFVKNGRNFLKIENPFLIN